MNKQFQTWPLLPKSTLNHFFYIPEDEDVKTPNRKDLNEEKLATLNILYGSDIAPSVIVKVMTESVHATTRKKSEFVSNNIKNIGKQEKATMEALEGSKGTDMNQAKRTMTILDRLVVICTLVISTIHLLILLHLNLHLSIVHFRFPQMYRV